MKVLITNDQPQNTGLGNYAFALFEAMRNIDLNVDIKSIYNKNSKIKINRVFDYASLFCLPKCYELYHFTNPTMTFVSKYYKPSIITVHDLAPYIYDNAIPHDVNFFIKMNMIRLHNADKIICISENTKKDVLKFCDVNKKDISVVYSGINHLVFRPRNKIKSRKRLNLPLDKKIILNVGTEIQRKNIPTLIKALAHMKDENVLLVRVGDKFKETDKLIKSLYLEKRILYFSPSNEELPFFYNAADVFVSTSSYEGFGMPILEAMASSCPVIAGNNSSIPEIVGKSGILLDAFDEEGYLNKITELLSNEELRVKIANKGYERSKLFSWNRCAKETFDAYKKVV